MLSVTITEKDGPSTTTTFDKAEVLIGRVKGNDVVLPKTNVSKRHSRIVVKDGKIILIDLKSTNGTFINGRKITAPHVMQEGDKVFIGDFTIEVREIGGGVSGMPGAAPGMPAFGGVPSAASLPSVGPMGGNDIGMGGMNSPVGGPGQGAPNFSRPGMPVPGMGPGSAPLGGVSEPAGPGLSPVAPAPIGGMSGAEPGLGGVGAPSLGVGSALGAPMGAPSLSAGPGLGGVGAPSLGAGPAGPSAPSLGAGPVGPSAPSLGAGPSVPSLGAGPAGPSAPSLGAGPAGPSAPSLGAGPAGPSAPSLGAGPGLSGAPSFGTGPSPSLSSPGNLSASPSLSPSLSASPSLSPLNARSQNAGSDGVIDKSLRLPGAAQSDRGPAVKSTLGSGRVASGKKEIGTAALPEDIIVDDARTAESSAWMKAARIVMDNYLSKTDFQAILAQPYPPEPESQDACYNMLSSCVSETRASLGNVDVNNLLDFLLKEVCGLGAVDSLIDDPDVSTFTVYNFETIVCERRGRREISNLQFTSADTLYLASQRLLAYQGINPQTSAVSEIRFEDGTQIQVVLPPVAVASTNIVVRKPSHEFNAISALIQRESLSSDMAKFLNLCVKARRNILIVGAQGAGRTSVLNALGAEIPDGERIVTAENSAVLIMPQPYVISLEAQNAGIPNGDLASLVRQAGRLRAERVLVDTLQTPADASAFLGAVCAGAQGSMATICGLTGDEGFGMLKRMVSSDVAARSLVGNIDIVVTVRAFTDARRRIVEIAEVVSDENGVCSLIPIFAWCGAGMGHMAMGDGQFKALGHIPRFYKELERGGMALEPSIFNA